ncbi:MULTISPECIES: hypothetical protein [Natrialbaceae]|nr:hypothetical protein [Natronococcus sp. CG52]
MTELPVTRRVRRARSAEPTRWTVRLETPLERDAAELPGADV